MSEVAITGATGFVGSALARALYDSGVSIRALARKGSDRGRMDGVPATWFEGDVTDKESLRLFLAGVEYVIHAAGMLGQFGVPELVYQDLHVEGTRNLLSICAEEERQPRILYVSSPGVLGPISGPAADETAPLSPSNPYERSKAAAEQVACEFAAEGVPVIIARPEFIYGPGDTHVLGLFQAVQKGMFFYIDGGKRQCHPTYVIDAVEGMVQALERGRPGEVYHITGPRPVTFRELAEAIADALDRKKPWLSIPRPVAWLAAFFLEVVGKLSGVTPPLTRTGVAFFSEDRRFSWEKARLELGYQPHYDLHDGVWRAVSWYQSQGVLS